MSTMSGYEKCQQCGYECADFELNCRTQESSLGCRMCGYTEALERREVGDGKITMKHTVREGSGALFYRSLNSFTFSVHYLSSMNDVRKVEDWLRKELSEGRVHADGAYLTRWIPATKAVEFVVGTFYQPPPCDEDLF
jgi:hypothetical protein